MLDIIRDVVFQPFETFVVAVPTTPVQISTIFTKADYIDSFAVSVDAAAVSVFIGGSNVTIANGLEIVAGGGPINFVIRNQRQHYELQEPAVNIAEQLGCVRKEKVSLPFIVWDLSQIYLVASAASTARIAPFRSKII